MSEKASPKLELFQDESFLHPSQEWSGTSWYGRLETQLSKFSKYQDVPNLGITHQPYRRAFEHSRKERVR